MKSVRETDLTAQPPRGPAQGRRYDGIGASYARTRGVLDPVARANTSGFARMPDEVVERVVRDVERDLADGSWDERNGHLRELGQYDAGLRLVVSP